MILNHVQIHTKKVKRRLKEMLWKESLLVLMEFSVSRKKMKMIHQKLINDYNKRRVDQLRWKRRVEAVGINLRAIKCKTNCHCQAGDQRSDKTLLPRMWRERKMMNLIKLTKMACKELKAKMKMPLMSLLMSFLMLWELRLETAWSLMKLKITLKAKLQRLKKVNSYLRIFTIQMNHLVSFFLDHSEKTGRSNKIILYLIFRILKTFQI